MNRPKIKPSAAIYNASFYNHEIQHLIAMICHLLMGSFVHYSRRYGTTTQKLTELADMIIGPEDRGPILEPIKHPLRNDTTYLLDY